MDKEMYEELRDLFDQRYKKCEECNKEMDEVKAKQAKNDEQFAIINTKLSLLLWGVGTFAAAAIGILVKYLAGG